MSEVLKPVTMQCTQKIISQMKNSFYKIDINDETSIIGIFSHIKNININIKVLILNKYITFENIDKSIKVFINNDSKRSAYEEKFVVYRSGNASACLILRCLRRRYRDPLHQRCSLRL